jgi:hypothetical protein
MTTKRSHAGRNQTSLLSFHLPKQRLSGIRGSGINSDVASVVPETETSFFEILKGNCVSAIAVKMPRRIARGKRLPEIFNENIESTLRACGDLRASFVEKGKSRERSRFPAYHVRHACIACTCTTTRIPLESDNNLPSLRRQT